MNLTAGFPVAAIRLLFTWYGSSRSMRSSHSPAGSPMDTQTSVYTSADRALW